MDPRALRPGAYLVGGAAAAVVVGGGGIGSRIGHGDEVVGMGFEVDSYLNDMIRSARTEKV